MSHAATNWALKQRGLKPATKIVLIQLADRHNPDYGCFPSQKTLADDCEMSERSVRTHVELLEQLKLLRRVQVATKGQFASTRYLLDFEVENHRKILPQEDITAGENSAKPAANIADDQRQILPTNPVTEPRKVNQVNLLVESGFSEFWDRYPRKIKKPDAFKAYSRALKKHSHDDVMFGLSRHLPKLTATETQFVPHPATWLNGEQFNDEPEQHSTLRSGPSGHTRRGNGHDSLMAGFAAAANHGRD